MNHFELVSGFSPISIRIRIRIPFCNLILKSYVLYVNNTHEIQFCSANFFQNFFFRITIRISPYNLLTKIMLYILNMPTKFGVALQSFCESQNSFQDQDHDFTLDFNTRPEFHTQKTPTKFCLDPLSPSKVIVSTARIHVLTAKQTGRQTDGNFFCLFCVLRLIKHEHSSKEKFFFNHAITILSLFTYFYIKKKIK